MDIQDRLDVLLALAAELEIETRRADLGGDGGGLCAFKGRRVLFIDTAADVQTRYDKTLAALAALDETDRHFLPPIVRDDLDRQRRGPARPA